MVIDRFNVLLSPPTSPRMSDTADKDELYKQNASHLPSLSSHATPRAGDVAATPTAGDGADNRSYEQSGSSYQAYRQSPYAPNQLNRPHAQCESVQPVMAGWDGRTVSQTLQHGIATDIPRSVMKDSGPSSPVDQLTPRSRDSHSRDEHDDDLIDSGGDDQGEESDRPPMTAAELRAAKRKMKRFRLTHSQTRFLTSEFARQAHPDAAHRERLAREIPGLSARQVQVWFQNRRAKLKRLTSDDRERMMRSRAVPADFDTTQALHSPFGVQHPHMGSSMSPMGTYPPFGDHGAGRPLTVDTLRRMPEYEPYGQHYSSPSGVTPAMGDFSFTPPQSASDHLSPGSVPGGLSPFVLHQHAAYDRRLPISMPPSSQTSYARPSQAPRLPLHERLSKTAAEPTSSPLRTSLSYSALGSSGSPHPHHLERAASFSDQSSYQSQRPQLQRNYSNQSVTESAPYGLGFSYTHTPSYTQTEHQAQSLNSVGVQLTTDADHFRRAALSTATYGQYTPSSFAASQVSGHQVQGYQAQYPSQNFSGNYQGHQHSADSKAQMQPTSQNSSQNSYQGVSEPSQQYLPYGGSSAQQNSESQSPDQIPPSY